MVVNKHQQKSEATRRKLLEAALRIFVRDGFEAARLEDIAKESGHTRGAFYANFDTKEDLFLALLEQQAVSDYENSTAARKNTKAFLRSHCCCPREFYLGRTDRPAIHSSYVGIQTLRITPSALARTSGGAHRRIRAITHHGML